MLLSQHPEGQAFVVSAPAGTGKTTLVRRLVKEFPSVVTSISSTTRPPREGEREGRDYHFLTENAFKAKIAAGDFLEYAQVYNTYYGTSRETVLQLLKQGKRVILTIDTQGALQLKELLPAVYIFIKPPSLEVLRKRLESRGTESKAVIEERLNWAHKEIEMARFYDYVLVNDDLDVAYQILRSILIAEDHKTRKN